MASKKGPLETVRPTAPPSSPALVRPAVGALLLSLSGACGNDDGTGTDGTTHDPPMIEPTVDTAPMVLPTTTNDDATLPPMPDPSDTEGTTSTGGDSTTAGGDSTASSSDGSGTGNTTAIPPMPPPTTTE